MEPMVTDHSITPSFPPVVYLPTVEGEDGQMRVEFQLMADGRRGLFSYSALDRLAAQYGAKPWIAVTVEGLQSIYDETPYDLLFLDRTVRHVGEDARPTGSSTAPTSPETPRRALPRPTTPGS